MNKDFKKPFSIPVSFETTKDFSTLLTYKEDSKYKPVIAVKAKDIFDTTKKRLDELKIILYGKFGARLRLEED